MLIVKDDSLKKALDGKVILLTGGGGGIGLEAAKAWMHMGARVIIAEVDRKKGIEAETNLNMLAGRRLAEFYQIDLSKEEEVLSMAEVIEERYGCPDVIFHNATITPMGAVDEVDIEIWDKSYAVNFRAPLLLTKQFLPAMKSRDAGVIVFVSSSGAAPYMGAYEVFKTAQIELSNTLCGELEDTGIVTFSIGPGLVKTCTAMKAIELVSDRMGLSTEEFYQMNDKHLLGVEEAGLGFALSVLKPRKYNGQEISSIQALMDFGFYEDTEDGKSKRVYNHERIIPLALEVIDVYKEQYKGWMERNVFERQWVLRDFKKTLGISADQFSNHMIGLEKELVKGKVDGIISCSEEIQKLKGYYERQYQLLQGYEKDPVKLQEHSSTVQQWIRGVDDLLEEIR